MNKKAILILTAIILSISIVGCNKSIFDLTYSFEYAIIIVGDGRVIEGEVTSWLDFEDGDQIQVTIDGITYLVHSSNITMMSRKP